MKRALFACFLLLFSGTGRAAPPAVQELGSVSLGTMTVVAVTTTPALAYSTGNFTFSGQSTTTYGQYIHDRVELEFYNATSTTVWVGYTPLVSTMTPDNSAWNASSHTAGRPIAPGGIWNRRDKIKNYWAVSGTDTEEAFITIQSR